MFFWTKYRTSAVSSLRQDRDEMRNILEDLGQKGLVGVCDEDPVRRQMDQAIEQIQDQIDDLMHDKGDFAFRIGRLKFHFSLWNNSVQKRVVSRVQKYTKQHKRGLQTKTKQREEYSLACRICFKDMIRPLQNDEEGLSWNESDFRLSLSKYQDVRPYLKDLAKAIVGTFECMECFSDPTLIAIRYHTEKIVAALDLIADDMCFCWWNGATHKELIIRLRGLMFFLYLFASHVIDILAPETTRRGNSIDDEPDYVQAMIVSIKDLSLANELELPSQEPEDILKILRENANVVLAEVKKLTDAVEKDIKVLISGRKKEEIVVEKAQIEQTTQTLFREGDALYDLMNLLRCPTTDFATLASGEVFSSALQASGIRAYRALDLSGKQREIDGGGCGKVSILELDNRPSELGEITRVAVKSLVYDRTPKFTYIRFLREAWVWNKARAVIDTEGNEPTHELITPLLGVWVSLNDYGGYQPSFVMPFADESNLSTFMKKHKVTPSQRWTLLLQIIKGIKHLHDRDIVHGDLKPLNVLIFKDDSENKDYPYKACLTDFGISEMSTTGPDFRTYGGKYSDLYASPELVVRNSWKQYGKLATRFSDIYAYGCMAVEVVSGSHPYSNTSEDVLFTKRRRGITLADDLKEEPYLGIKQRWFVEACLSCIPEHRPRASDLVADISSLLTSKDISNDCL